MLSIPLQQLVLTPINAACMTSIMLRGGGITPSRLPDACPVILLP